jgi:macrolide-specific efflux system membrane fusion protein
MTARATLHVALAALLAGGGVLSWRILHEDETTTTTTSSVVTATKGNVLETVTATGNLAPLASRTLDFPTSGVLTSVSVVPGQHVAKGQQLARIDDTAALAQLATAKAAYLSAVDELADVEGGTVVTAAADASAATGGGGPQQGAATRGAGESTTTTSVVEPTESQLDTARAKVLATRSDVIAAMKAEADTALVAPFDGTVASVEGAVGDTAGSGQSRSSSVSQGSSGGAAGSGSGAATGSSSADSSGSGFISLVDLSGFEVQVSFTEAEAVGVSAGQSAQLTVDAVPGSTFTGTVTSVDLSGSASANVVTFGATVSLDPGQDVTKLRPAMTAQVSIVTRAADGVVTLPSTAVSGTGSSTTLSVVGDTGKVERRIVTIGLRGTDAVEVTSGLAAGEKVKVSRTSSTSATSGFPGGRGFGGFGGGGFRSGGLAGGGGFRAGQGTTR